MCGGKQCVALAIDQILRLETKTLYLADLLALDNDISCFGHAGKKRCAGPKTAHGRRRLAVDKALGEALVERVG